MTLTKEQQQMFLTLKSMSVGSELCGFLGQFCDHLCDIRTMDDLSEEARKARLDLARLLDRELISRLRLSNPSEDKEHNPYV